MSPEDRHEFESVWPELAVRLKAFLARKQVPLDQREDLVQETGARLVANWDSVDTARPTWPLAMTIALNLVRDRARRRSNSEVVAEIPDLAQDYDLEAAGLARLELARVRSALPHLSSKQRDVLLAEIGDGPRSSGGDKMTRSRARRKLNHLVGRVSAGLSLQFRRLADLIHATVGTDGALQGLGCSACALLAVTAVLVPHTHAARSSELTPFQRAYGELLMGGHEDVSALALSGGASRASAPGIREGTVHSQRARRTLSGAKTKASTATTPAATEPAVPDTSDLPNLPGRGAPQDEVPVPRPPQSLKALVEKMTPAVSTKVALPRL